MKYRGCVFAVGLLSGSACIAIDPPGEVQRSSDPAGQTTTGGPVGIASSSISLADRVAACTVDPRVVAQAIHLDTCVGGDLFLRETFGGNGRSCGTCHPVDHDFTIDPAFIATLPLSSPLFVAETNPNLAGLERPPIMHQFGLILENLDGPAPSPSAAVPFVMRSVPHTISLATSVTRSASDPVTIPADRTGWSGDGAPGNGALRDFQTGAIRQHYTKSLARIAGTDFRIATDEELRTIDLFMRGIGRTNGVLAAPMREEAVGA